MTSSARARIDGGIVRPSAFAVLRLTTSSNVVGCSTGRSAGFAPLRILSTEIGLPTKSRRKARSIRQQHPRIGIAALPRHTRQMMAQGERGNSIAHRVGARLGEHEIPVGTGGRHLIETALQVLGLADVDR